MGIVDVPLRGMRDPHKRTWVVQRVKTRIVVSHVEILNLLTWINHVFVPVYENTEGKRNLLANLYINGITITHRSIGPL